MREQQTGGKGRFCIFSRHADKRATGAARIVVDEANQIFLPIEQLELLADEPALGDEASLLDELDDVGRGDLVVAQLLLPAPGHGALISQGRDSEAPSSRGPAARDTIRERGVARNWPNRWATVFATAPCAITSPAASSVSS